MTTERKDWNPDHEPAWPRAGSYTEEGGWIAADATELEARAKRIKALEEQRDHWRRQASDANETVEILEREAHPRTCETCRWRKRLLRSNVDPSYDKHYCDPASGSPVRDILPPGFSCSEWREKG